MVSRRRIARQRMAPTSQRSVGFKSFGSIQPYRALFIGNPEESRQPFHAVRNVVLRSGPADTTVRTFRDSRTPFAPWLTPSFGGLAHQSPGSLIVRSPINRLNEFSRHSAPVARVRAEFTTWCSCLSHQKNLFRRLASDCQDLPDCR